MRFTSTLLSICLHLTLVLGILFWPASSTKMRLDVPTYQVKLVSLVGKRPVGKTAASGKPAPAKPAPTPPPAPEPAPAPPKPEPVAKPVPIPEPPKPAPAPPKPDATPISPKKAALPEPPKPVDEPKPKEEKKPEPKPDPKKPEPKPAPKPEPKKPEKSAEDILKDALADTSKEVKETKKSKEKAGQQQLNKELADMQAAVSKDKVLQDALAAAGDEGMEGPSSDGVIGSIEDLYAIGVKQIVQKNWRFPQMATRDQLVTRVRIILSPDGAILDSKILSSSGRPDFDASALRAVADTKQLPKPPSPDITEIAITFNSHDL